MINREFARTISKKPPPAADQLRANLETRPRHPGELVFMNLAQCTNLSRAEQIGGGGGANVGRVRGDANLSAIRWRNESKCQNQP